jgi:hypothetical protein
MIASGRRRRALLPLLVALPVIVAPGVAQADTARDCFDGAAAITVEEQRLTATLPAGRPGRFDIERWAGAWRGGSPDNLNESVRGQIPPAAGWPQPDVQFIETTLPYEKMLAAPAGAYDVQYNQAFCVWPDSTKPGTGTPVCRTDAPKPGEIAASGGGGNYLRECYERTFHNRFCYERSVHNTGAGR